MPAGGEADRSGFCILEASWLPEAAEATAGVDESEAAAFLTVGPEVEYSVWQAVNIPCHVLP